MGFSIISHRRARVDFSMLVDFASEVRCEFNKFIVFLRVGSESHVKRWRDRVYKPWSPTPRERRWDKERTETVQTNSAEKKRRGCRQSAMKFIAAGNRVEPGRRRASAVRQQRQQSKHERRTRKTGRKQEQQEQGSRRTEVRLRRQGRAENTGKGQQRRTQKRAKKRENAA